MGAREQNEVFISSTCWGNFLSMINGGSHIFFVYVEQTLEYRMFIDPCCPSTSSREFCRPNRIYFGHWEVESSVFFVFIIEIEITY